MCMRYISYVESFRSNFLLVIESARDRSYSNEEPARTLAAKRGNSRRCLLLLLLSFFLFLFSFSRTNRASRDFLQNHRRRILGQSVTRQDTGHDILKLISPIANHVQICLLFRGHVITRRSILVKVNCSAKDVSNRSEVTKLSLTRHKAGRFREVLKDNIDLRSL